MASTYDRRSSRGLWAFVRVMEWKALKKMLGVVRGLDIVEFGCGSGFYTEKLRDAGANVLGVDLSSSMIAELRKKGIGGEQAAVENLQLHCLFSVILAAGLSEFMPNVELMFSAAARHAKADAKLLLLVPRKGFIGYLYQILHQWKNCPVWIRSTNELQSIANRNGWLLEQNRGAGPLARVLCFSRRVYGEV